MKIGLVARADATGLGIQTQEFYENMKPYKTMVVDLSKCSNRPMDLSKFPGATVLEHVPYPDTNSLGKSIDIDSRRTIDRFLDDLDIVFTCETPYDYFLFIGAQQKGVKSVLQYNFELLDYAYTTNLPKPDLLMAPSMWRYDDVRTGTPKMFLPVPVNTDKFPRREYTDSVLKSWFHPGGNLVMEDRNGTQVAMDAWEGVDDARLTVTTPAARGLQPRTRSTTLRRGLVENYQSLYPNDIDGFVFPRKFGGLCLPLNEAAALGLPIVMTDVMPQNEFLIKEALVPTVITHQVMTKCMIDIHEPDQVALADVINRLSVDEELVDRMRIRSQEITEKISWKNMHSLYEQTFDDLMDGKVEQRFEWGFDG